MRNTAHLSRDEPESFGVAYRSLSHQSPIRTVAVVASHGLSLYASAGFACDAAFK